MNLISHDRLTRVLRYDPDSGQFFWLMRSTNRIRVGEIAGSLNSQGYRNIKIDGGCYRAARLAWFYVTGAWPSEMVDHINGNRSDDRIANLRECTNAENTQNRRAPRGAYPCAGGKFFSTIMVAGKRSYLGRFDSAEEARSAYAAAKYHMHRFSNPENLSP